MINAYRIADHLQFFPDNIDPQVKSNLQHLRLVCQLFNLQVDEKVYKQVIANQFADTQDMLKAAFDEKFKALADQSERLQLIEQLYDIYHPDKAVDLSKDDLFAMCDSYSPRARISMLNVFKEMKLETFDVKKWEAITLQEASYKPFINYLKHLGIWKKLTPEDAHNYLLPALLNLSVNRPQPDPKTVKPVLYSHDHDATLPHFNQERPQPITFEWSNDLKEDLIDAYKQLINFNHIPFYQAFMKQDKTKADFEARNQRLRDVLTLEYNHEYPEHISTSFMKDELGRLLDANREWAGLKDTMILLGQEEQEEQQQLLQTAYERNAFQPIKLTKTKQDESGTVKEAAEIGTEQNALQQRVRLFLPIAIQAKKTEAIPIEHLRTLYEGKESFDKIPQSTELLTLWQNHPESENLNSEEAFSLIIAQIKHSPEPERRGLYLEMMKRTLKSGFYLTYISAESYVKPLSNAEYIDLIKHLPEGEQTYEVTLAGDAQFDEPVPSGAPAAPSQYDPSINNLLRAQLLNEDWLKKIAKHAEPLISFIKHCQSSKEVALLVNGLKQNTIPMEPLFLEPILEKCTDEQKAELLEIAKENQQADNYKDVLNCFDLGRDTRYLIPEAVQNNNLRLLNFALDRNKQNRGIDFVLNTESGQKSLIQQALDHQNYQMIYTLIAQNHAGLSSDLHSLQKPAHIDANDPDFKNFKVVLGVYQNIAALEQHNEGKPADTKSQSIDNLNQGFIYSVRGLAQSSKDIASFKQAMSSSIETARPQLQHHRGAKGILDFIVKLLHISKEKLQPETASWSIAKKTRQVLQNNPEQLDDSKLFK